MENFKINSNLKIEKVKASKLEYFNSLINGYGDIETFIDCEYKRLNKFSIIEINFGESLAIEVAIMLIYYRILEIEEKFELCKEINSYIYLYAIGVIRAIELSDFIENFIKKYEFIEYKKFSEIYLRFKEEESWLKSHAMSKSSALYRLMIFSKVKENDELFKYLTDYHHVKVLEQNFNETLLDLESIRYLLEVNENISIKDFYNSYTNVKGFREDKLILFGSNEILANGIFIL